MYVYTYIYVYRLIYLLKCVLHNSTVYPQTNGAAFWKRLRVKRHDSKANRYYSMLYLSDDIAWGDPKFVLRMTALHCRSSV